VHSPFSTICNTKGPNGETTPNPTKSPTINLPDTPNTIETTLKFALTGLPDNVDVTKLKTNVLEALKVILARLTKRVPDLQVVGISEQVCGGRRLAQKRQLRVLERRLRDVSVCYTVEVSNSDDGTDYEALIVTEARDSYGVILDEIRTKMNYVNVGMNLVPLGGEEGSVGSNSGTLSNGSTGGSNSGTLSNGSTGNGGLPGWGIALIVILLLVLVCCIGYCIFASARTRQDDKDAVNILFNNPASRTGSNHLSHYSSAPRRRSFVDTGLTLRKSFDRRINHSRNVRDRPPRRRDDGRRRRNRYSDHHSSFPHPRRRRPRGEKSGMEYDDYPSISLSNPQDPKFREDEFTVNTYTNKQKISQDPPMYPALTMPGYEPDYTKPDPEGETAGALVLALTNGDDNTRNYPEEPDTKPKLEPEPMLIEAAPVDRSRSNGRNAERSKSPPADPSVNVGDYYVESQQEPFGVSSEEMSDDDAEEYDQYGFRGDEPNIHPNIYAPKRANKKSEERFRRESLMSFATEDPEDEKRQSKKSSRKHKKKHKKQSRRGSGGSSSWPLYGESTYTFDTAKLDQFTANMRKQSGVDSRGSENVSIDLESSASK